MLQNTKWKEKLTSRDVDENMTVFYRELGYAYNISFHFTRLSQKQAVDKPWITSELKQCIEEKHMKYKALHF